MHPHSSLTFRFQVGALAEVHPRSSPVSIRTHHDSIPRSRRCVRHRDFERRRGCFADGVPRYVTTRDSITCIVRFIGTKTQCAVVLARPGCRFRRASSARSAIRCVPRDRSACLYYFGRFLRGFLGRLRLLSLPLFSASAMASILARTSLGRDAPPPAFISLRIAGRYQGPIGTHLSIVKGVLLRRELHANSVKIAFVQVGIADDGRGDVEVKRVPTSYHVSA
jgi:hypothetical protein